MSLFRRYFVSRTCLRDKNHLLDVSYSFPSINSLMEVETIEEAHHTAKNILSTGCIPDSEDSSRHILSYVCNLGTRYSDFQNSLKSRISEKQRSMFATCINRRLEREPVQYIIGEWDFYGSTFLCRKPMLIPRPETEELVEHILKFCSKSSVPLTILDIGSGTGAIGISLLKSLQRKCKAVTAIDINPNAVSLSLENADRILSKADRDKYSCICSPILDFGKEEINFKKYDIIVSNPPYIPSKHISELQEEVVRYEDILALDGGDDGLSIVKEILHTGRQLLSPSGPKQIWMEVSEEHPLMIESYCNSYNIADNSKVFQHYDCLGAIKDLSNNYRFSNLRLRNT